METSAEQAARLQEWFSRWQQGQQQQVMEEACARALNDEADLWEVAFACWTAQQLGEPGYRRGLPVARLAIQRDIPWAAVNVIVNTLNNAQAAPDQADEAATLLDRVGPYALAIDPIGPSWNLLSQGRSEQALELLKRMAVPWPGFPPRSEEVVSLLATLRSGIAEIASLNAQARQAVSSVDSERTDALDRIGQVEADLKKKAQQTSLLVDTVMSGTLNKEFEGEATRNATASMWLFWAGIGVLGVAAVFAVLPLAIHYWGGGPDYSSTGLLAAHTTVTLAFAAIAGVLLSRARTRDRARQRARDLAIAMGTIIAYSNTIEDPTERQSFMHTMGQLVVVAHLQADKAGEDQVSVGLANILAAVKTPPPGS